MAKIEIISDVKNYAFISKYHELATESHLWIQWRLLVFLKQLKACSINCETPLHGVEVGCGRGVHRYLLEKKTKWIVDGMDIDKTALISGREGHGQLFLYDILEKKEDFQSRYDFIILYDVIEHIKDTQQFLEACLYHLKSQGYLFINVPALPLLWSAYDVVQEHQRRYTTKALISELNKTRVKILDIRYWGFSMVPFLLLRKLVTLTKQKKDDIFQVGFKQPAGVLNFFLRILMKLELLIFPKPFWGTSLMAIAQKE